MARQPAGRYDPDWLTHYYDEYGSKEWDRLDRSPSDEVKLHIHRHFLTKHVSSGDRVLEVGAGPGRFTQLLAELGARIVVTDISPVQLQLNRERAREFGFADAVEQWIQADVCEMREFDSGSFDVVVAYGGPISYVFERAGRAVDELVRTTRAGGILLVSVMSLWGALHSFLPACVALPAEENERIIASGDLHPETHAASKHHCHMFTSAELRSLLEDHGAEVLEMAASNCLATSAWGQELQEIRSDKTKWDQLLHMELQACTQGGCLDMGTHLIAVARKPDGTSHGG